MGEVMKCCERIRELERIRNIAIYRQDELTQERTEVELDELERELVSLSKIKRETC